MKTIDKDLVDEIFDELDILDDVELDTEDRVLYSKELLEKIREEISKIPMGKIITQIIQKESEKLADKTDVVKAEAAKDIQETKTEVKKDLETLKKEMKEIMDKLKEKYDELKSDFLSFNGQQWYQFGGYPPPGGVLPISSGGIDQWRLIIDGDNLSVQKFESGVWVEKGAFLP